MSTEQSHGQNPSPGAYDLSGTTVVVTGGNAGIGVALARGVGRAGATVAIWARNDDRNRSFLTTRAAARHMIERGSGSIVVVSSMVSRYGAARQAAYAVTKSGLVGLGRTLAVELARYGIRVNILVPGWTITAMNEFLRADPKFMKAATARIPLRRWATDEDDLDIAPFLAHSGLTYHTGNEVVVDGGYSVF
ncbi:SDR family oxidoreductase [Mycobacterium sp. Aquia_216]|uniref:SDR family NAD(P)-dependent oxidoreductase n=1 Tax=Mycobacterium sp. Aquia_216 TaxID=2991729 RepID=UPI00227D4A1F|nr:SDR family oxidoreductase [Mycobacterium sp. Aquia_216]WAJ43354.1 SDR family oxidoreductase [Mycobacterium sp. Aquia_216]